MINTLCCSTIFEMLWSSVLPESLGQTNLWVAEPCGSARHMGYNSNQQRAQQSHGNLKIVQVTFSAWKFLCLPLVRVNRLEKEHLCRWRSHLSYFAECCAQTGHLERYRASMGLNIIKTRRSYWNQEKKTNHECGKKETIYGKTLRGRFSITQKLKCEIWLQR